MEANKFELIGYINYVDVKFNDKGTQTTNLLISKKVTKNGKDEYETYPVVSFIEGLNLEKKQLVHIKGKLGSYQKPNEKTIRINLVANEVNKVKYDKNTKKYIIDGVVGDEEIPF